MVAKMVGQICELCGSVDLPGREVVVDGLSKQFQVVGHRLVCDDIGIGSYN